MWPDRRLLDLFGIEHPIVQAPMAGSSTPDMAVAAAASGALASLACATLSPEGIRAAVATIRGRTDRPLNLNFFCHRSPIHDESREASWRATLRAYYDEHGLDPDATVPGASRTPFDEAACEVLEEIRPAVASFHFGLPDEPLLARVRAAGCLVVSSATTVAEARWLTERGADAVVAQGAEAGGHRGMFLTDRVAEQPSTFALVPQVVDAVRVPVIAAGGIADGRGLAAALMLGAAGVQVGTAYLRSPESAASPLYREALASAQDDSTALTNLFTGRPARGLVNRAMREIGHISDAAPAFPLAAGAMASLRKAAEAAGRGDFSPLWAGQAAALATADGTEEITRRLARDGLQMIAPHDRLVSTR